MWKNFARNCFSKTSHPHYSALLTGIVSTQKTPALPSIGSHVSDSFMCWNYLLTTDPSKASVRPGQDPRNKQYDIIWAQSLTSMQQLGHRDWRPSWCDRNFIMPAISNTCLEAQSWKSLGMTEYVTHRVDYSPTNLFELELIKEVCIIINYVLT